ncbi:MAG TPA: hypothetical protein VFV08_15895, partial [Puia sp.]|nr:hypothetical protein [Puia sp.]
KRLRVANPKLCCFSFLNQADPIAEDQESTRDLDNKEGAILLKQEPFANSIQYLDSIIVNRKAWRRATTEGLGITEFKVSGNSNKYIDPKAVNEFENFMKNLLEKSLTCL